MVFERKSWPAYGSDALEDYGDQGIEFLLKHFSVLFGYLGGDAGSVAREYSRLKSTVMRDPNVRVLPYALSFTSASSTTPQTRPTRCTFTTCYSLSPLLCAWRHRHIHLRAWVFAYEFAQDTSQAQSHG